MVMKKKFFIIRFVGNIFIYDLYKNQLIIPTNKAKKIISKRSFKGVLDKNNPLDKNPKTILVNTKLNRELSSISFQVTQGCNLGCYYCPFAQKNDLARYHDNKMMDLTVCIITSNINLCILKDVFISNLVKNKMSITEETLIQEASLVSELSRKYDFLIIEIPRGIIQINDYIINSLGLYYSFYRIISKPNFQVVDIPWQFSDIETKKAIEKIIYDKYMDNIDVITINNTFLEDLSNFSPGVNDKLLYIQSEVKDSAQILKKCLEEKIRFGTIK